jgi:hypothetical protein
MKCNPKNKIRVTEFKAYRASNCPILLCCALCAAKSLKGTNMTSEEQRFLLYCLFNLIEKGSEIRKAYNFSCKVLSSTFQYD